MGVSPELARTTLSPVDGSRITVLLSRYRRPRARGGHALHLLVAPEASHARHFRKRLSSGPRRRRGPGDGRRANVVQPLHATAASHAPRRERPP
jgi:hypothetical protein